MALRVSRMGRRASGPTFRCSVALVCTWHLCCQQVGPEPAPTCGQRQPFARPIVRRKHLVSAADNHADEAGQLNAEARSRAVEASRQSSERRKCSAPSHRELQRDATILLIQAVLSGMSTTISDDVTLALLFVRLAIVSCNVLTVEVSGHPKAGEGGARDDLRRVFSFAKGEAGESRCPSFNISDSRVAARSASCLAATCRSFGTAL